MNMKRYYLIPLLAGALLATACEKDHRNDHLVDPQVFLVHNGVQSAVYYDVEETCDYPVYAYGSGYFSRTSEVSVELDPEAVDAYNLANGTSFTLLDPSCYEIATASATLPADTRRATMTVRLRCKQIMELPLMNDYLIPLRLRSEGSPVNEELDLILINPRMQQTEVAVREDGVVESDLSGESSSLDFTVYTAFDNKWDSETEYEYGDEVLAAYNAEHGTAYLPLPGDAYVFRPADLKAGSNEAVSTVEIDKSKLGTDRFYTLAVRIKSNSKFRVGERNTTLFHISLRPIRDNRSQWKLVSCSSYYTGRGPELMIDGNLETRWESRYNSVGEGDINPDEAVTVWDMGRKFYWCGVTIVRRNDKYVTDLRAGYIELSDDGVNWTKAQDFDFGGSTNLSINGVYSFERWSVAGRYVRLAVNASNRQKLYHVSEFIPVLAEAD